MVCISQGYLFYWKQMRELDITECTNVLIYATTELSLRAFNHEIIRFGVWHLHT